jgi:hypothetical protein
MNQSFLRQNQFASIGFLLAFVALALAVLPGLVFQPPRPEGGLVGGLLHALSTKLDPAMQAYETRQQIFKIAGIIAAIAAAALALVGVVRHERRALAFSALGVAGVALVWQYVIIGVVVAVALAIVLAVLN